MRSHWGTRRSGRIGAAAGLTTLTTLTTLIIAAPLAAGPAGAGPAPDAEEPARAVAAPAQDQAEAVMIAAGQWALERLGADDVRLDPHRTGDGEGRDAVRRVARALGAELGTLEETRQCVDVMDPSTCRIEVEALLAIAAPRLEGEEARVKVYAWYASDSPRQPVAQQSWELRLRRTPAGWRVTGG